MVIDFNFVPPSGPLSGLSFESQIKQGFNDLGREIKTIEQGFEGVSQNSSDAWATAVRAEQNADKAHTIASHTSLKALEALDEAHIAHLKANQAQEEARASFDLAALAKSVAQEAQEAAHESQSLAHNSLNATVEIKEVADNALSLAQAALNYVNPEGEGLDLLPIGIIVMWGGNILDIPLNWALCDGGRGTPDLRNRFIIGTSETYPLNSTGGSNEAHTHGGTVTVANHTLSTAQMPAHTHQYDMRNGPKSSFGGYSSSTNGATTQGQASGAAGGSQAHNHGASLSIGASSTIPAYYALAYIMFLGRLEGASTEPMFD
ncbi:MAG: hypothetical protein ACRCTY_04085 [Candidatus Adiutrix sp.]